MFTTRPLHSIAAFSIIMFWGRAALADPGTPGITWRVGVGSSYRSMGGIRFDTGSFSGSAVLPQLVPSSSVNNPFGPETGFADRTYDNGFVFQDINTGNPGAFLPGTTAFWGYNDNSQVQGGNLVFTGTGTSNVFSETIANASAPSWKRDHEGAVTPSLDITGMVDMGKGWHLGASFGFMAPRMKAGGSSTTFRGTQQSRQYTNTVTDTYALQGVIPPLAPYAGTFNPGGPMPVIDNEPTSRALLSNLAGMQTATFSNSIEESLQLNFYTFSLGPVLEMQRGRWSLGGSMGFAMNIVDWRASFKENLTGTTDAGTTTSVGAWEATKSDLDVLGGLYLQWQAGFSIAPGWSVNAFGRHDWMSSLSAPVGPSTYKSVLDGFTFGGGIQFRF